jgi:ribosomal 30S subunit maturation factor RimM
LAAGEYYLSDLVGAEVVAPDGVVGKVVELGLHPSVDTLIIETADGTRVEQPMVETWVKSVDTTGGRVELSSRDGLIA